MSALVIFLVGVLLIIAAVALLRKSNSSEAPSCRPPSPCVHSDDTSTWETSFQNVTPSSSAGKKTFDDLPPWAFATPDIIQPLSEKRKKSTPDLYSGEILSDQDTALIREEMEEVLGQAGRPIPTKSQWGMIVSNSKSTRVIAGAGSGKSTALSLRVIFLHKYLGIPLEQITVVTFTRASRSDMVKKLTTDLRIFGANISEGTVKRIVRTFHSMILSQVTATSDTKFIEHIGSETSLDGETDDIGALNPRQLDYIRTIYADAYQTNQSFRRSIGLVLLEKISQVRQSRYSDTESLERAISVAEPRDRIVTQAVTDAWLARTDINPRVGSLSWEITTITSSRGTWHANGRVQSTGMPIVLGCGGIQAAAKLPLDIKNYPLDENDKSRPLGFITNVRLKVLATVATERYLYIESDEDLGDLYSYLDWVQPEGYQLGGTKGTFPAFSIRVPGDTSSTSIFECLYTLGTFIASMGIHVHAAAADLAEMMNEEGNTLEAHICSALSEFWPALHQPGHSTYNELFLTYGNVEQARTLPAEVLLPMKHLLIDEFQDISGQIIKWIMAVHSVLHENSEYPSLTVVGDDWQSVYGWRGSDPEFLINFDDHFGNSELVVMNENYRSGQQIINSAELLVGHLKESALQKHGVASGHAAKALGQVELSYGDDKAIQKLIDQIRKGDPEASIYVLSRTNEGLTPFWRYSKDPMITMLTMHRAKGLEADHVIVKGDCSYSSTSALKNAIYLLAGLKTSYDDAQLDEALRLAYVAITRARKKVYWFGEPVKPDGAFLKLAQHIKPV